MTNEEAIAIIRNEYKCVDRDCDIERSCGKCELMMPSKEPILEAYKMAIKALEQQPCEDVVSRKDAEQMFRNIRCHLKPQDYKSAEEFNTRDLMLLNAEQMIHALPSVTQKSGKWILSGGYWRCSECKEKALLKLDKSKGGCREYEPVRSKHCPSCGIKMQESEEV